MAEERRDRRAGLPGARGKGSSELARFRSLARALAVSDGGDDSWLDYLRRVSGALVGHFGAEVVEWDLRHADAAMIARADAGEAGIDWTVFDRAEFQRLEAPAPAVGRIADLNVTALPLGPDGEVGTMRLGRRARPFGANDLISVEIVGGVVGAVLVNRFMRGALRERVKEIGCLYRIARIAERADRRLEELLPEIARALPEAWQHADVAAARIELDDRRYDSRPDWSEEARMSAGIVARGARRGAVHVVYRSPRPASYEGPFLREERSLIEAVAREIGGIVERGESREERSMLEEQIRHADRLATIGQLAAGVAHELNEPLGAMLGFAELLAARADLQGGGAADARKIVDACLRARAIVNKLRLFARQTPPRRQEVDLNGIIDEGLYFTEAQCARQRVRIVRDLDADLPGIEADAGQMHQLLTNLTVNAMQAMPDGGVLTIRTRRREREVALVVEDTGVGMDAETRRRIFEPFFTTKPADQGTGLGLSVVHGIVAGHGGSVEVESAPGRGSIFEVRLPLDGGGADQRKEKAR